MTKTFLKEAFGWGFALWLIGYALGFAFFALVPPDLIGWAIMPVGTAITLWVLIKKVKSVSFRYFAGLAVIWTLLAVVLDYVFLVKLLKPADGYYKLDVYLYYASTLVLPMAVGWYRGIRPTTKDASSGH